GGRDQHDELGGGILARQFLGRAQQLLAERGLVRHEHVGSHEATSCGRRHPPASAPLLVYSSCAAMAHPAYSACPHLRQDGPACPRLRLPSADCCLGRRSVGSGSAAPVTTATLY